MKKLFLLITLLAPLMLNGCIMVVYDAPVNTVRVRPVIPVVAVQTYCGVCYGRECGYDIYRSYHRSHYRTTVYQSSTTRTYPYYSTPTAPQRVYHEQSYRPTPQRQVRRSESQSYSTRRHVSRSRTSVRQAPSRQTVSRSNTPRQAEERKRTVERTKRRRRR